MRRSIPLQRRTPLRRRTGLRRRSNNPRTKAYDAAWQAFSLFIRMRDGFRCLMGEMYGGCGGPIQAGHVIPAGASNATRWAEDNVFGQCRDHNKAHFYNQAPYNSWYVKTYGADAFNRLVDRSRIVTKAMTEQDLWRLKTYYEHKIAELKVIR